MRTKSTCSDNAMPSVMSVGVLASLVATAVLVAGCGGSDTARSAAEEELPAESEADSGLAIPASSIAGRLGSVLGSQICITNSTSQNVRITGHEGFYDTASGLGLVAPGGSACLEGTSFAGYDAWADLRVFKDQIVWEPEIIANNKIIGAPYIYVPGCTDSSGFAVGESRYWDSGILAFEMKRVADDGWKEFRVNLTDSPNPTPNTPSCWGARAN